MAITRMKLPLAMGGEGFAIEEACLFVEIPGSREIGSEIESVCEQLSSATAESLGQENAKVFVLTPTYMTSKLRSLKGVIRETCNSHYLAMDLPCKAFLGKLGEKGWREELLLGFMLIKRVAPPNTNCKDALRVVSSF